MTNIMDNIVIKLSIFRLLCWAYDELNHSSEGMYVYNFIFENIRDMIMRKK